MPSLSELGQFRSSFNNIANEKKDVTANDLPFDDLELPKSEAPPFNYSRDDFSSKKNEKDDDDDSSDINIGVDPGTKPGDDGFDFSAFVNDLPDVQDDIPAPTDGSGLDDLFKSMNQDAVKSGEDALNDLLAGLSNDAESASAEPPDDDFKTDDLPADDFSSSDLPDDLSGGDLPSDDFSSGDFDSGFDDDDEAGIDMGGESPLVETRAGDVSDDLGLDDNSFDLEPDNSDLTDDESGIDLGGEVLETKSSEGGDDFSLDNLSDDSFDLGDLDVPAESESSNLDDFGGDFSADTSGADDSILNDDFDTPPSSLSDDSDPIRDFSEFGADFESDSIDLGANTPVEEHHEADFSGEAFGSDDFSLAGLDDILNKTKTEAPVKPEPKKGLFGRKKESQEDVPEAEESIDEISLPQEDVDKLLRTLSAYPLNLRIHCEELIAEQVLLPAQLSKLIRLLVNGAHVKEAAALVEEITGKPVIIPKSFEKMTGAAFEEEQSSFGYIFIHNFLPVLRLFAFIAAVAFSVIYLSYIFIYTPLHAESIYKRGYERIPEGEYQRANELFHQAFTLHKKKKWFYLYAEAFRDQRRYTLAEGKYDELLRHYPRDKKGVLDYAYLNTYFQINYEKANRLLQRELLDFAPNDFNGLLAAGDNFILWADSNPALNYDRYEDARFSYARLLELYGWLPPVVERMMTYFIRTDNLRETLFLRVWFENDPKKRPLSPESRSELGGYLLDKQLERPAGVPDPYLESIDSVRSMLLSAALEKPELPEPHYHLARYHHNLGNNYDERLTLENAIRAFDLAKQDSVRRRLYRVDAHYRYANLLVNNREFFPADEELIKGIRLYEDFVSMNLIPASPQLGQLYALRGDLEYFVKAGDMRAALDRFYLVAENYGYAPPEIQYRMGAAYYQLGEWQNALQYLYRASSELPLSRRLLYALGNVAYQRNDFFAAQGYFNRLIDVLESQRVRLPILLPNDSPDFLELGERLMMARNNAGVVHEALAEQTGNRDYRSRAMALYAESARAWDSITRNPQTMTRMSLTGSPGAPSINLGYLNANNALRPSSNFIPQVFVRIDRDVLEPSKWEELTGN